MKSATGRGYGAVELYGWESKGQFWHGPTELPAGQKRHFDALIPDGAFCTWRTKSRSPDGLCLALATSARDLDDCALATIDIDGFSTAPISIVVAIPAHRREVVRSEFAFELTAFVRFLQGPSSDGSELLVHDQIERVLANERRRSIVFALSSSCCNGDMSIPVSEHIEHLATELVHWLRARDSNRRIGRQCGSGPITHVQPVPEEAARRHHGGGMDQRSLGRRSLRSEDRRDVPA
jgi:hypothetical protein